MGLQLLLDSADPIVWKEWLSSGLFNGVTTNPTLLRRANQPCQVEHLSNLAKEAERLGCKELHLQAWGNSAREISQCGKALGNLATPSLGIHVKIPITAEGSKAAKILLEEKYSVTFTACYEVQQVIIATALGANYIAPYMGRINDQGRDAHKELIEMQKVLMGTNSKCRLLVASLRNTSELCALASEGLNTFTINPYLAQKLFEVPATWHAAEAFNVDAAENSG